MTKLSGKTRLHRGATLVFFTVMLVPVLAMIAFAVDIGYIVLVRTQLQCAADAAALAGAHILWDGPATARATANGFAQQNSAGGSAIATNPSEDIELGRWDEDRRTFNPLAAVEEEDADSVRVTCRLDRQRGNAVKLYFARIFGIDSTDVSASAVALSRRVRCGRIVGLEDVDLGGSGRTDSYNSDNGTYNSQTPGDEGHVCSNGGIKVGGSFIVNGDASPGDGYSVTGSEAVTGSTESHQTPISATPIDVGDAATNNDNDRIPPNLFNASGDLRLGSGDTLVLLPGVYYLPANLEIVSDGALETTGETVIYVQGDVTITGRGLVNSTGQSANLEVYLLGSDAKFAGQGQLHAVVYGPDTKIQVSGQGDLFGAVLGRTLTLRGNGSAHYDEALGPLRASEVSVKLVQ